MEIALAAATIALLNRRAFYITEGAINATISRFGPEHDTTAPAVIEELTGVNRHNIRGLITTFGTSKG
jgi:hypothetical protein